MGNDNQDEPIPQPGWFVKKFDIFHLDQKISLLDQKLSQLLILGEKIMSGISNVSAEESNIQNQLTQMSAAIADIQTEFNNLNNQIAAFSNGSSNLNSDDQASLDAIQAASQSLVAKLQALDTINPQAPAGGASSNPASDGSTPPASTSTGGSNPPAATPAS